MGHLGQRNVFRPSLLGQAARVGPFAFPYFEYEPNEYRNAMDMSGMGLAFRKGIGDLGQDQVGVCAPGFMLDPTTGECVPDPFLALATGFRGGTPEYEAAVQRQLQASQIAELRAQQEAERTRNMLLWGFGGLALLGGVFLLLRGRGGGGLSGARPRKKRTRRRGILFGTKKLGARRGRKCIKRKKIMTRKGPAWRCAKYR